MTTFPPASDASLEEWRRWAIGQGKGHLDPARLRAEAVRLRETPIFGLGEAPPIPDVEQERPVLTVDPGPLDPIGRAELVLFLRETALRAAAGAAGSRHPAVVALQHLADAIVDGPGPVELRTGRLDRERLFAVVQAAYGRTRSERLSVEPPMRRVLAAVELWAFGEAGWQPPEVSVRDEWDGATLDRLR